MLIFFLIQILSANSHAQYTLEPNDNAETDLLKICIPKTESSMNSLTSVIAKRSEFVCKVIQAMNENHVDPIEIQKTNEVGQQWKIRFHFGFSRTQYDKTDLRIDSKVIKVVVKDVEMHERTSAQHYNPANWHTLQNYGQWIDEPTNTFTLSLEKKKQTLYLTIYHPKYLKSLVYKKIETDNAPIYEFNEIEETDDFSAQIPPGANLLYLGNTHLNMIWQLGYGRQFVIFNEKRSGKLSYTIKGDIGIQTGKARSVHIVPGVAWDDYYDHWRIQGANTSIGHRMEFQRGRYSVFIDQKTIYSNVKHAFYDGTISYELRLNPVTFGLGIDLYRRNRHSVPVK